MGPAATRHSPSVPTILDGAVLVLQPDLGDRREGAEGRDELVVSAFLDVVQAAPQQQADDVLAGTESGREVVGVVEGDPVVVGPARRQDAVSHALAVGGHLVLAQAADVHEGSAEPRSNPKLAAKEQRVVRAGVLPRHAGIRPDPAQEPGVGDPAAMPVRGLEDAHRPGAGHAPGRRAIVVVPDPHLPEDPLGGAERAPAVGHVELLRRLDPPAVPDVPPVRLQALLGRGDQRLPGLLPQPPAAVPRELPRQSRRRRVHAQRVRHPVAAQLDRGQGARVCGHGAPRPNPRRDGESEQRHSAERAKVTGLHSVRSDRRWHQQTRATSMSSRRPSFSIFEATCPTPTAQWWAGPCPLHSFT